MKVKRKVIDKKYKDVIDSMYAGVPKAGYDGNIVVMTLNCEFLYLSKARFFAVPFCNIGSRSIVVEGARVCRGAKLGAGVVLTSSTPVIDSATGNELSRGIVPERAVAVPATRMKSFPGGEFGLSCVLVLRTLEEGEMHDKLALNAILRDHGLAQ